jgi:tRNA(Arg) A34 adenosine deaminase TadA
MNRCHCQATFLSEGIERIYSQTSRILRIQNVARQEATKSNSVHRLGAIITKGNVIVAKGYNQDRNSFLDRIDCHMHAEMSAVNNFLNGYVRRNPKTREELHRYTIWCVRIPWDPKAFHKGQLYNSIPCNICLERLRYYGFGKIVFVDEVGSVRMWKLTLSLSKHIKTYYTTSQRRFLGYIRI